MDLRSQDASLWEGKAGRELGEIGQRDSARAACLKMEEGALSQKDSCGPVKLER